MILVIDDDEDVAEVIVLLLKQAGHSVKFATTGASGLTLAGTIEPRLILLDWNIPLFSGADMLSNIAALPNLKDTPIILMTAGLEDVPDEILKLHAHLSKPFDADALTELVSLTLKQARKV